MTNLLSRRDFIRTTGVLIVSFSSARVFEPLAAGQGQFGTRASHIDPRQLDSWIAVNADGTVTAYTGKCELGQGMLTAQTQLDFNQFLANAAHARNLEAAYRAALELRAPEALSGTPT